MCKNYYGDENCISSSKTPIGTGLYKISEVSTNQIVLEKNESYRDQDKANKNVNRIYINLFKEVGEVYNSFKIGNIDIMNTSSPLYENYIGKIGYYVKEYKGRELDFLSCNCNDYLMKNKSIRQAINYAIDRENIVSTIYNNKYYTSDYILDYGSYLYNKNNTSSGYNPEKARDILNQDGWVYSNNRWRKNGQILAITISVNSSNSRKMRSSQKY
jgi:ABC-type transport system substrate-binding protein